MRILLYVIIFNEASGACMNCRLRLFVIASALSCALSVSVQARIQDTGKNFAQQPSILRYSTKSISYFIKNIFTRPDYPQERLALNFVDVAQTLSFASRHSLPRHWISQSLDLFSHKLYGIYVNADAWHQFSEALVHYVAPFMDASIEKERLLTTYKQVIGAFLTDEFDRLLERPDEALDDLALQIYETKNSDLPIRELQHTIGHFLHLGLSLLTWSPELQEDAWHIMTDIGHTLDQCVEYNLIDEKMHEDLVWVLIRSFSNFLDTAGAELTPPFFTIASQGLSTIDNSIWCLPEREKYLRTKYDFISTALMQATDKAIRRQASVRLMAKGYRQGPSKAPAHTPVWTA